MNQQRFLVTGGGGFVGKALCKALLARGDEVVSVARSRYPELEAIGVRCVQADLSVSSPALSKAFEGVAGVFHVAAKVDMWGPYADFYKANVVASQNVVEACRSNGVGRIVFTSSPSVIAGEHDLINANESLSYPKRYEAFYPQTKAMAEELILKANGPQLATCALRPHLIFGPGDTNLIPTIVERAKGNKLVQIGNGENLSDFTFIEDCVRAHILAMDCLQTNPDVRGQAFFISQGDPFPLWKFVNEVLRRSGLPSVKRRIPLGVALAAAGLLETVCKLIPGRPQPRLTRFLAREMATSHYFDISRAKSLLGFVPQYTVKAALDLTFSYQVKAT